MEEENVEDLNPEDLEVVISNGSDEIIIRDTQQIGIKDDELKTTEYFLVENEDMGDENQEEEFLTVENDCEDDQEEEYIAVEIQDTNGTVENPKKVIEWNEICRICASGSEQFIPIFIGEGLEHELANKINTYLPLEISEDDTLPQQACYNCAATLISWHEMFKGCLDAQQRLIDVQNKINSKDQYSNGSSIDENLTTVLEPEIVSNGEQQVDVIKNSKQEETEECVEDGENERLKGSQRASSSFKEFQKTYKPALPATKGRKKVQSATKSVRKRASRAAKKKPVKRLSKKKTAAKSDPDVFGAKLKIEVEMDTGINNESTDFKIEEAEPEEKPKKRSRRKINASNLECSQCNKKFRMYTSYQVHLRLHTGEKPYTCHICGKQFGQTGSLYYHLKHVHGGVKNHACDICGRSFAMKTAMEDHRRIHTGERPYICDSCGKTFKTKASLYIHSKIHTNEYPFKCSYCKKLFRWKQQMISHLTTHTGEKNHICDICGKGFGVKNELTRHRRTHSLDKPFTCQMCGVSFGQKRYLTNHNRTRHKIKAENN